MPAFGGVVDTTGNRGAASLPKLIAAQAGRQKFLTDSFKNILLSKGFMLSPADTKNKRSIQTENEFYTVSVLTSSLDSVQLVYNLIKSRTDFLGVITLQKSSNEDAFKKTLRERIIKKAKNEAAGIARLKATTRSDILSIKETQKREGKRGWTVYPPLSGFAKSETSGWHTTIHPGSDRIDLPQDDHYLIKTTLVIRFAVK